MDLNLRQVRAFVTVAQTGSFTRAAALLNLSQPALTVQIRRLEETLEARLIDRDSRNVGLTRLGRDLLPGFRRVIDDLDAVVFDTRERAAGRTGIVRVATLPSFAASLLPDVIAAFRADHPRVAFQVRDVIAQQVLDLVRDEVVDLGIIGGAVADPAIDVIHATSDALHVVYPVGHPVGTVSQVTIEILSTVPLVLMNEATSVRTLVDAAFLAAGRRPMAACEATYMMTAVGMVRAGLGLTILPGSAREIQAEPDLCSRPIADPGFERPVSLIKKAGRTMPAVSEQFSAALQEAMTVSDEGRRI